MERMQNPLKLPIFSKEVGVRGWINGGREEEREKRNVYIPSLLDTYGIAVN